MAIAKRSTVSTMPVKKPGMALKEISPRDGSILSVIACSPRLRSKGDKSEVFNRLFKGLRGKFAQEVASALVEKKNGSSEAHEVASTLVEWYEAKVDQARKSRGLAPQSKYRRRAAAPKIAARPRAARKATL